MKKDWREKVDPIIKTHLEAQINATLPYRNSYSNSKDKGKAQLWIAIASLSKQIFDLNLKLNYLERVLRDLSLGKIQLENKKVENNEKIRSKK